MTTDKKLTFDDFISIVFNSKKVEIDQNTEEIVQKSFNFLKLFA